jgi:two-component system CheB/CheR fusion protein
MLLAEALGATEMLERVKIFATDIDEHALRQARQAVYRPDQLEAVPAGLRERWFKPADGTYRLDEELRRSVIFGRNDLLRDAPISKLDLLACRNTLMYFNAEAQGDVLRRFQLALNDGGYVILGKSETMLGHAGAFAAEEPSLRIFRKLPGAEPLRRLPPRSAGSRPPGLNLATFLGAIEHGPVAQLVLDPAGRLAVASAALRRMFKVHDADIGRPLQDLELSYRPVDLRSLIAEAAASGESQHVPDTVTWRPDGDLTYELDIEVTPLRDAQGADIGTSITFLDATGRAQLTSELDHARRDADTAYEELQTMVEELETTNEELQSTNEELETTNEELQSTIEELETTNEELQSTGAEHQAVTDELGARNRELGHLNATLNAILHAIGLAVATVDSELRVELWNERARDLWGVSLDDVRGRHLLKLDIGLPVAQLLPTLTQSLEGSAEEATTTLTARDRRGREFACTVRCIPLRAVGGAPEGAIVIMEAG